MTTILLITTSPRQQSFSRQVAGEIALRLLARHPGALLVARDLAAMPPPHPDPELVAAILTPTAADDDPAFTHSEELIGELEAADFVVIGTPMNNFTVPSNLKAWIDHIVRIRRSFRSTPEGKIGLLRDRPVYVVATHGGHLGGPAAQPDFLTPYLTAIFHTIGIDQIDFVRLEGLSRGTEAVAAALARARDWLETRLPLPAPADC